jgi:hypothetical protein
VDNKFGAVPYLLGAVVLLFLVYLSGGFVSKSLPNTPPQPLPALPAGSNAADLAAKAKAAIDRLRGGSGQSQQGGTSEQPIQIGGSNSILGADAPFAIEDYQIKRTGDVTVTLSGTLHNLSQSKVSFDDGSIELVDARGVNYRMGGGTVLEPGQYTPLAITVESSEPIELHLTLRSVEGYSLEMPAISVQ